MIRVLTSIIEPEVCSENCILIVINISVLHCKQSFQIGTGDVELTVSFKMVRTLRSFLYMLMHSLFYFSQKFKTLRQMYYILSHLCNRWH